MDQLIELARRLGRQMAGHERTALLKAAQEKLQADAEANDLLKEYQQQGGRISQLEQDGKPIEPEDKHKLQAIEAKLSGNATISELTRRQADFLEMTSKVKRAIDGELQIGG